VTSFYFVVWEKFRENCGIVLVCIIDMWFLKKKIDLWVQNEKMPLVDHTLDLTTSQDRSQVDSVVLDMKCLAAGLSSASFRHVSRSSNEAAHIMARTCNLSI
jgi:hypothetical protein